MRIDILNKLMWIETDIKELNKNPKLPPKVKKKYQNILDNVASLKLMVSSLESNEKDILDKLNDATTFNQEIENIAKDLK